MSEVKHAALWFPPQFPLEGRLPSRTKQVQQNIQLQRRQERDYHDSLSVEAGRRVMPPCCKTLHISLCFDGTGNNLNNDFFLSTPRHPTNIARMFRASIGDGYAGGVGEAAATAGIVDLPGTGSGQYFKYYMPGVGTPFPEVGDLNYTNFGLAAAGFGEERINWGLMMIIDALRRALLLPRQDHQTLMAAVKAMGTPFGMESILGKGNRKRGFYTQFAPLLAPLRIAMTQTPGQSRLLGIKLYVYGFSRGATAARAFVSWLNDLLSPSEKMPSLKMMGLALPVSVEYLGLLDTVASVGAADILPGADGHMGWADGNQELPEGKLIKRCLHLVASHEQRLCFPLESIRRETGSYPANSLEVIYPGVHSDQGGGYPPGDQGKAISENNIEGDGLLLSQIALNDLYADAFAHGAPLKVPKAALSVSMSHEPWRAMDLESMDEFDISPALVNRFNAWRQVTLGLAPSAQPLTVEQTERYEPQQATTTLENALREQMAWITAWRIDRYAFASLEGATFYKQASNSHALEAERVKAALKRAEDQKKIQARHVQQSADERAGSKPRKPLEPGLPGFDPDIAKTQLREAADEFGAAYRGPGVLDDAAMHMARRAVAPVRIYHWVTADARAAAQVEREQMKAAGQARVSTLFPPPKGEQNHLDENRRGRVDESRNANQSEGLLRALFDDQVHDSRAWFLYAQGREPYGNYFVERMVFFGDANRRELALYEADGTQLVASAGSVPASDSAQPTQMAVMSGERLALAQKNIDALWPAHNAKASGANDALA